MHTFAGILSLVASLTFFYIGVGFWRGTVKSLWQPNKPTNKRAGFGYCAVSLLFFAAGLANLL